jgi:hypothetical protein
MALLRKTAFDAEQKGGNIWSKIVYILMCYA